MASEDTYAGEIKGLRQRLHDLSDEQHRQGLKVAAHDTEITGMKEDVKTLVETTATREQLRSESQILRLELQNVANSQATMGKSVDEVRRWVIAGVSIVMTAFILAVIAMVIQGPK